MSFQKTFKKVSVEYAPLIDYVRRVFADPVQRSSLRFGLEDVQEGQVTGVSLLFL
jgi:hypothetical protein